MKNRNSKLLNFAISQLLLFLFAIPLFAMDNIDIAGYQKEISGRPVGERIALWAEKFVGTPYDTDPLGDYVTKKAIVADERIDCMYLSFRAVELAMSRTPEEALNIALDKRFQNRGIVKDNMVVNYEDRFQYGEDMIESGKWGREITGGIGPLKYIKGGRGREKVAMVSKKALMTLFKKWEKDRHVLKSGDFIFFIKSPEKRAAGEVVGHIGIIKTEGNNIYLIHAGGNKNIGGVVRKVLFQDYVNSMPFSGIMVSRFD